jgi:hypothetical protein
MKKWLFASILLIVSFLPHIIEAGFEMHRDTPPDYLRYRDAYEHDRLPKELQMTSLVFPEQLEKIRKVFEFCGYVNENKLKHLIIAHEMRVKMRDNSNKIAIGLKTYDVKSAPFFFACAIKLELEKGDLP